MTVQPLENSSLRLVHALPGRIRLRAVDNQRVRLDAVAQELRQQEGVYEVRTNEQTGSLLATFDVNTLPLSQMLERLQQQGVSQVPGPSPQRNQKGLLAVWQSGAFWKEQGRSFIPLFAGLVVTQALRLQGWQAILVYVITAGTTNQLISQFEPDARSVAPAQPLRLA